MSFSVGRGRQLRSGHVYQRQLATVSAAAAATSRQRSPSPPGGMPPPLPPRAVADAHAANVSDPYHMIIVAHVRGLNASASLDSAFNDDQMTRTLDTGVCDATSGERINFSASVWKCPICLGVPRQPISINACGHVYCDRCVHTLMATNPSADFTTHKCAMCRAQFRAGDLFRFGQWPLLLKQTWALLRVRCEKCGDCESSPQDMVHHERVQCVKRVVTCPGCWYSASVENVCEHAVKCDGVVVNCIRCGYPIRHVRHSLHDCEAVLACERRSVCETGVRGVVSRANAVPIDGLLWG
jgi:hypothetical protein